ncbi:MAG: serine hydrolase, partial [Acidaminobacteraceae bacterium]
EDPINYILSKALYENPDTNFNYNSGVSHLLSVIIESNTGLTTYDFANKYLFEPLAIKKSDIKWQVDKKNRVYGGHGLSMKIDDLEKIGVMYLNGGLYHGERIVSKSWTYESTLSHSKKTRGYAGYGYQFWIGHIKNEEFYGAFGHAGQRIYVFKDLDMVVTFLGNVKPEFGIQEKLIRNFIFDKQ